MIDAPPKVCQECGNEFVPATGRRGRSPYCDDCMTSRRRAAMEVRRLRTEMASMIEMVEVFGPLIAQWRREVRDRQDGKCWTCHRERRLYFARDPHGELIGVCADCRVQERRSDDHDSAAHA